MTNKEALSKATDDVLKALESLCYDSMRTASEYDLCQIAETSLRKLSFLHRCHREVALASFEKNADKEVWDVILREIRNLMDRENRMSANALKELFQIPITTAFQYIGSEEAIQNTIQKVSCLY